VVVRAPEAPPTRLPKIGQERRARIPTLIGIGAREAMPTLFDVDVADFEDAVTSEPEAATEGHAALEDWNDDECETCFDVE